MANRAQRRAANHAKPAWQRLTLEQRKAELIKNGITPEYVDEQMEKSLKQGFKEGQQYAQKYCFAAAAKALHDLHGFGQKRIFDVLSAMDESLLTYFTSQDIIDEVWEKTGLSIDFDEPLARIYTTEGTKK